MGGSQMKNNIFMKMAYPATFICAILYVIFLLLYHFKVFDLENVNVVVVILAMFILYVVVWALLHLYCRINIAAASYMRTFYINIGVSLWNILLLIVSAVLLIVAIVKSIYLLIPLFVVVIFSMFINLVIDNKEEWYIKSPSEVRWGRRSNSNTPDKVRLKAASQDDENDCTEKKTPVEREFKWEMKNKWGIDSEPEDNVIITLFKEDWEDSDPYMRRKNPFYGKDDNGSFKWIQAQRDIVNSTKIVLKGPDENDIDSEANALKTIVDSAVAVADKYNLAAFEVPELLLTLCQYGITYKVDEESTPINQFCNEDGRLEYFRFSSETLYDMEGDCDCKAILAYRLMNTLGIDTKLVTICKKGQQMPTHVAIIFKDEENRFHKCLRYPGYTYCEATGKGWRIGNVPKEYDENTIEAIS